MVNFQTGLWVDYSQPGIYGHTVTLPIEYGGYLLTGLTIAVTLAGGASWTIFAVLLHSWRVHGTSATAIDLQYQVSLQNTSGAPGTIWHAIKLLAAWRGRGTPSLFRRTLAFALPALLIWTGFTVAGVFVSRVASKSFGSTVARVKPTNCGFLTADVDNLAASFALAQNSLNQTIQARAYMVDFYTSASASLQSRPLYIQPTLPYSISISAACPIPAADRCLLGPNGAFSMATDPLDSQTMLGINSKPADRVTVQLSTVCSPFNWTGLYEVVPLSNDTWIRFYFGRNAGLNYTYEFAEESTIHSGAAYLLQ
jgi:hypothetical protein